MLEEWQAAPHLLKFYPRSKEPWLPMDLSYQWSSDDHMLSDIDCCWQANTICPIDYSISQVESMLFWLIDWWFWGVRWQNPTGSKCQKNPKNGFSAKYGDLDIQGRWWPWGIFALLATFFGLFLIFPNFIFFAYIFLVFLYNFWHDSPIENLMRNHARWRAKFLIFQESRRLCHVGLPICS